MQPTPQPKPGNASFRLHFIVPLKDGKIISDGGPMLPEEAGLGDFRGQPVGHPGTYAIACDPNLIMDGIHERGTNVPCCVFCPRCKETPVFKKLWRPHPRDERRDEGGAETESNPCPA